MNSFVAEYPNSVIVVFCGLGYPVAFKQLVDAVGQIPIYNQSLFSKAVYHKFQCLAGFDHGQIILLLADETFRLPDTLLDPCPVVVVCSSHMLPPLQKTIVYQYTDIILDYL